MSKCLVLASLLSLLGAAAQSGEVVNGSNLNGANLNGANLNGANLNGANLNGSNLNGSDLGHLLRGAQVFTLIAPDGTPITLN